MNQTIENMKARLAQRVEEWTGSYVPEEGDDDYEAWSYKFDEVRELDSIKDVSEYVESEHLDFCDFVIAGEYDLVSAGMKPVDIPKRVVLELGEETFGQLEGSHNQNVISYGGKIFVFDPESKEVPEVFSEIADACSYLNIEHYCEPTEQPRSVLRSQPDREKELKALKLSVSKRIENRMKTVKYLIVTNWPDGTMAFKFGSALQTSLHTGKESMQLVQSSPERVFRVTSAVSEREFKQLLSLHDVSYSGKVILVEI